MTITVTPDIIAQSAQGSLECPVFRALRAAGLSVQMVGCGQDPRTDTLVSSAYLIVNGESVIQRLPSSISEAIKLFDRTGKMDSLTFDLPDL